MYLYIVLLFNYSTSMTQNISQRQPRNAEARISFPMHTMEPDDTKKKDNNFICSILDSLTLKINNMDTKTILWALVPTFILLLCTCITNSYIILHHPLNVVSALVIIFLLLQALMIAGVGFMLAYKAYNQKYWLLKY